MSTQTHNGSCHCGAVRYTTTIDLDNVIACNCSMCGRSGTILGFVTPEQFTLLAGEDNLQDYQFNKHVIHHTFCKTCGIKPFARGIGQDGKEMVAVNVRCLEDIDTNQLEPHMYDGKSK